jgi:hypothetical protein
MQNVTFCLGSLPAEEDERCRNESARAWTADLKVVVAIRASLAGYLTELQGGRACGPVSGAVAVSVLSPVETCLTLAWRQGA